MLNYFKSVTGTMSNATMQTHVTTFDDADPSDTRRAHREAREAEPRATLLTSPRLWDLDAPERCYVSAELGRWPMPPGWTRAPQPRAYLERARTEAPPMRQSGVTLPPGVTLAGALAELPGLSERKMMAKRAAVERRRAA